jgi:hypothetical protein
VKRVNRVLEDFPGSELKAILWHQGEHDVGNPAYQADLDQMIAGMRMEIVKYIGPKLFIAGGLVPFWVGNDTMRRKQQEILRTVGIRCGYAAYADPESPFVIDKPDNLSDANHYDANGQREMGRRYFEAYTKLFK